MLFSAIVRSRMELNTSIGLEVEGRGSASAVSMDSGDDLQRSVEPAGMQKISTIQLTTKSNTLNQMYEARRL